MFCVVSSQVFADVRLQVYSVLCLFHKGYEARPSHIVVHLTMIILLLFIVLTLLVIHALVSAVIDLVGPFAEPAAQAAHQLVQPLNELVHEVPQNADEEPTSRSVLRRPELEFNAARSSRTTTSTGTSSTGPAPRAPRWRVSPAMTSYRASGPRPPIPPASRGT